MMSSTYFETKGSSSGRRLYIQVWHSMFQMHQYKHANILCHTSIYNRLPEDKPSGSKYVEDILN
jgi:hypothetical protein